jgi:hypothetical protein
MELKFPQLEVTPERLSLHTTSVELALSCTVNLHFILHPESLPRIIAAILTGWRSCSKSLVFYHPKLWNSPCMQSCASAQSQSSLLVLQCQQLNLPHLYSARTTLGAHGVCWVAGHGKQSVSSTGKDNVGT